MRSATKTSEQQGARESSERTFSLLQSIAATKDVNDEEQQSDQSNK